MKKANVVTGIIFLALSIFAYVESLGMTSMLMTDSLGPSFWPKCLSVVMGSLSIVLILQGFSAKKKPAVLHLHLRLWDSNGWCWYR